MKWKARSQPHRTSIRQEQKSQVVRGVHYSEDGVEDISLKRKKKAGRPNLATTQGDMLKKKRSQKKIIKVKSKAKKMYAEKMARICHSQYRKDVCCIVRGGHRGM